MLRSLLFAPGDSARKMEKALASGADAVILDLEDAVAAENKPTARAMVRELLCGTKDRARQEIWVRINPLDTPLALPDLGAIVAGAPDGLMLPKPLSAADVTLLDHYLTALEAQAELPLGRIRVIPVVTETAASTLATGTYAGSSPRLAGLTWGSEDLATALGAISNRDDEGRYSFTYQLARSLCLIGCHAAGVAAIETVFTNFRDPDGLAAYARLARRDGFNGLMAIHPDQVAVINAAFTPSAEEIAEAEKVVAVFAANPGAGTIGFEGRMLDMPHLKQARHTIEIARRAARN